MYSLVTLSTDITLHTAHQLPPFVLDCTVVFEIFDSVVEFSY